MTFANLSNSAIKKILFHFGRISLNKIKSDSSSRKSSDFNLKFSGLIFKTYFSCNKIKIGMYLSLQLIGLNVLEPNEEVTA